MPGAVNKPKTNEKGHRQLLSMSLSLMNRFSSHWRVPAFLRLLRLFGELSPDRWRLLRRTSFLFFLSVSYQSEPILSIYNRIIFILSEIVHIAYNISDISSPVLYSSFVKCAGIPASSSCAVHMLYSYRMHPPASEREPVTGSSSLQRP